MSEGSKMGLFGSKDEKKESTSADTTKQDSLDRYAPYCIDSDSETYDTEALSIMDINDIIGVQSGQAAESTLESEIAALTEIITDSKGDTDCDTMNDIHGESSDIKFNDELLTEFTSLSPSENPLPTTSREGFDQGFEVSETEVKNIYEMASDKSILESTNVSEDSSSKYMLEVKTDTTMLDEVATEDKDTALCSVDQNNELDERKAEPRSVNEAKEKSPSSPAEKSFDDTARIAVVSATEEDRLPVRIDAANSEITNSETETISQIITDSVEVTSAAVEISLDNERKEDNKDAPEVSNNDAVKNTVDVIEDVDSVLKTKSEAEEAIDDPEDGKLTDVLTNMGSTSKSLQLIGEAYISEDSQETDEKDESPVVIPASVPLDGGKEQETEQTEEDMEPLQKGTSDNVSTNTLTDELKINVIADNPKNVIEKCNLDDQDSRLLEDNKELNNTAEVLPNLQDNPENSSQDPSVALEINAPNKDDQIIEEDESVDSSLRNDEHTDKNNKIVTDTSLLTVSNVPGSSTTPKTTSMTELVETQGEPLDKTEQLEDILSDSGAEMVKMTIEDEVKLETNRNSEEIQGKTFDQAEILDEKIRISEIDTKTLNPNDEVALEVDNISTTDPEPLEESEASPSVVLKTELENTTEMDSEDQPENTTEMNSEIQPENTTEMVSEIQPENTTEMVSEIQPENTTITKSAKSPEPVDVQDNTAAVELNIEEELTDFQSNEESLSSLQHSTIEDKLAEKDSESSMLAVETGTNSEDEDNQYATTVTSARKTISTEEQSKEISDSVERHLETTQESAEECTVDSTIIEKDIPLATKVTDDNNTEITDEDSCVRKMILSIRKAEEKMDSERSKMRIDSPIVEETGIDSSNDMPTSKEEVAIEDNKEEVDKTEGLEVDLDQAASVSSMDNNAAISNVTETNKQEETVDENLSVERDNSIDSESVELSTTQLSGDQIKGEGDIGCLRDTPEFEIPSDTTIEDVSGSMIETTSENITPVNIELPSLEIVEPNSSKDNLLEAETMQKTLELQKIDETEIMESGTEVESNISATDKEEVSKTQASEQTQQLEENQSITQLAVDTEEKQTKATSDKDNTEIEQSESITEPSSEMVAENTTTVGKLESAVEATTIQDPLERDSHSASKPEKENIEEQLEIQPIERQVDGFDVLENQQEPDDQSENITQIEEVQRQKPDTKSEILSAGMVDEKQQSSEIQLAKLGNKTGSQTALGESLLSVPSSEFKEGLGIIESEADINPPETPAENTPGLQIGMKKLEEMESESTVLEDVAKSLEELQEEKLLSTKPLDDENLDEIINISSSGANLELSQALSDTNEIENNSGETVLNLIDETVPLLLQTDILLESEVKIDEDLQCEPIEDLEKLAVVADDILIDELANSVLKDATESLENINNLEILPDSHLSLSTIVSSEELKSITVANVSSGIKDEPVSILEEVNERCFIETLNQTPSVSHGTNYITDVIISSTNIDSIQLTDNIRDMDAKNVTVDAFEQRNQAELVLKTSENLISKDITPIDESITDINEACKLEIEEDLVLDKNIEIDLPLKQEEAKLIECAVLRACDAKIDLPDEVLFDADNAEPTDVLCSTTADNADTSQQSSEFSELECAVKFLQESEEQTIDSPLLLSPKVAEEIIEETSEQSKSCLFLSETEVCQETLELPVELEEITPDSIAISEAEIISEAAKLENERKLKIAAEMSQTTAVSVEKLDVEEKSSSENNSELLKSLLTTTEAPGWEKKTDENIPSTSETFENTQIEKPAVNIRRSEKIPKISILEERLKEPPKIEIPVPEGSPKISDMPTTPKTSLLIQRDSRMYQKMLESPKGGDKSEPKIVDTPRKDSDKYDFENVGSPRIILKIAKSAIADCGEPRSPKSPKIRSAANSPNPEDSPGQKLGKIKLKLSKGGHPSIISNENFDETAQRHTEAILSPSHIGMKIKLSKTGDASIIQPEKHDSIDEIKESKHKFEEASPKRIESPLGMKIKLSKTGDPSIVQQESKESTSKRKDKLDIGQEIPKRTDSPIGMKIKLSKSGDASIIQPEKQETSEEAIYKDKFEIGTEIPKRTESPIGMKIKLSKTGDASIISSESCEEYKDSSLKSRDKLGNTQDIPKRTDSPLGMKFKLSKSGGASIIQPEKLEGFDDFKDKSENLADITKRVESPIGMKIKLLRTGDASIIHPEKQETEEHRESIIMKHREKSETQESQKRTDSPLGMRIKVTKTGEASVVLPEEFKESFLLNTDNFDIIHEAPKRNESPIGMKIKLSKSGDASIIHPEKQDSFDESKDCRASSSAHQEGSKSSESSLGMKIKLSKTGDASIIHPEISPESKDTQLKRTEKLQSSGEGSKRTDSPLGMKIKLSKTGDASIIEPDKKDKLTMKQKEKLTNVSEASPKRKEMEYPLEMKIKLSKTGHPTIIANDKQESLAEMHLKSKDHFESSQSSYHKRTESTPLNKDSQLRIFKTGHSTIIQSNRSEVTIEPIQIHPEKLECSLDISPKCKDLSISSVELKKSKLEAKLSHILPEVTIQPIMSGEQKQIILDKKSSTISRQQMSVINQEISITQVSPSKPADLSMSGKLKEILRKNATNSPANSDCEIIEHRPELIIVNENSNSSQDIMIIEEVKAPLQEVKIPRKRGRPKRSSLPPGQLLMRQVIPQDPLALDNMQPSASAEHRESDRPKRTCRNQKSYAPPKRGRGRGRGKRKMDRIDCAIGKIPRLEDPLTAIERSTMSLIAPLQPRMLAEPRPQTSELYKALKQSPAERKRLIAEAVAKHGFPDAQKKLRLEPEPGAQLASDLPIVPIIEEHSIATTNLDTSDTKTVTISEMLQLAEPITAQQSTEKLFEAPKPEVQETKNIISDITTTEHQNWLTPSIKLPETTGKTEAISMVQVMDEETRMSAESNSRSQTPARNISIPVVETVINEESQGSVLSTATTESEKVKVKNRRMEINFDPDEGPFTVDKIAEYEWPPDKKGDTFMIQEQISQYLGVKSFKRKYPDLKRRMVEMEERNFLRENCLVSEAMCDMGLTAICSTEVLDIMCSDFPDQYEEYRKHMREKQAKEHSKKQKELTAAANAERNRIDLAEMAVQSALSWNVNFNKARKESRKYSLDLQSFTIHVPKKQLKVDAERKASNYPVALIPGQYTDYYREYTPAELRYYPLNTVLYGPMRPNERKFDSQSEGSQSDSDSDSSSDDSSSSSSEGTQDTEESQSTVDEVDMEIAAHKEDNKNLKCKMCLKHLNKHGKAEVLIQCGTCNGNVHPSCIDLTLDMVPHIQGYSWQCTDCKTCVQCHNPADEDKMLFCDMCDRGYHIYCVGLRRVPQGRWHCRECAVCASCGLRQPGGANSDRNSVAQWQHEYKKGERNTRVYVSTLCVPCSKLWRKGRYCPHCSRCHSAQRLDLEPNLIHCSACDKYLHLGCVEIRSGSLDRKNYICECCSTPGQQFSRSLISKNFKT